MSRPFSKSGGQRMGEPGQPGKLGRERRESLSPLLVSFQLEDGRLKGVVQKDFQEGLPRSKVVFIAGYRPETAASYKGRLPKAGETWECDLEKDTRPDKRDKGALIVRPIRLAEHGASPHSPEVIDWFKRRIVTHNKPEDFLATLPHFLDQEEQMRDARLFPGQKKLFAVSGDRVVVCQPYLNEQTRGTALCWSFHDALKFYDDAPAEVKKLLQARKDAADAQSVELERAIKETIESLPELQEKFAELNKRAQGLGLKGGEIVVQEDGFKGGYWRFDAGGFREITGTLDGLQEGLDLIKKGLDEKEAACLDEQNFRDRVEELSSRFSAVNLTGQYGTDGGRPAFCLKAPLVPATGRRAEYCPKIWASLDSEGLRQVLSFVEQIEDGLEAVKKEAEQKELAAKRGEEQKKREQEKGESIYRLMSEEVLSWSFWSEKDKVLLKKAFEDAAAIVRGWGPGRLAELVMSGSAISVALPLNLSRLSLSSLNNSPDAAKRGQVLPEGEKVLKYVPVEDGYCVYIYWPDNRYPAIKVARRRLFEGSWSPFNSDR